MSAIPLQEEDFVYPTSSPKETGPLRLLTFKTVATNTVLSLSLVDAKEDDEYFAISYAWQSPVCKPCFGINGDITCETHWYGTAPWTNNKALCNEYLSNYRSEPDGYREILIDGQKFYVQDTVYHLLLAIQKRLSEGELFWLDTICINQNDTIQRDQETSNMHEIYKAAQHVYVWLGTAYDSSDAAMDFLYRFQEPNPYDGVLYRSLPVHSHPQDLYREMYSLLDRPYWKRTWVIQEFLLARNLKLLCGDREVHWTKAQYLVDWLDLDAEFRKRNPLWNVTPGVKIIQARKAFRSWHWKPPLEDMIYHFLFSRSTYPEDKLIGLLNVSLSSADTDFNGTPGSIEKRIEVINEVVRDIQGRDMGSQTTQAWKHLLACLLGVPSKFPKPSRPGMSLLPTRVFDAPLSPRRTGRPATTASRAMRVRPREVPRRRYAATSTPMPIIGSVRLSQPAVALDILPNGTMIS